MPIFFGLGTSTYICSQSINDRNIIKQHGSQTWYGCWIIKALVEAEVLYDGFYCESWVHSIPLIIARPLSVSLLTSNYKTSIKPIYGKNALVTLVVYIYIVCGYQTSHH
jgi:hypothetical protein